MEDILLLKDFIENVEGGEGYWHDFEGNMHIFDRGYLNDFLNNFIPYVESLGGWQVFKNMWEKWKEEP